MAGFGIFNGVVEGLGFSKMMHDFATVLLIAVGYERGQVCIVSDIC